MSETGITLTGEESGYLKMLEGLRPLELSANEAAVVARIARFAQSGRVLEAITQTPKWYARWEIREALLQNARIPERVRDPIDTGVAIIDLMRELDSRRLQDAERSEIRDDIRSLLKSLPPVDHEVVKAHARSLAAARKLAASEEAPPPPPPSAEEEAAADLAVHRAARAETPEEILSALYDARERVRRSAMENKALTESVLLDAVRTTTQPDLLTEVATHPRWAFLDGVRAAVLQQPLTPAPTRVLLERTREVIRGFLRYFNEPMEPDEKGRFAKELLGEVQGMAGPEKEYVKFKVGDAWTPFIREVMRAIEDEFKRVQPRPVTTAWPAAPAPPGDDRPQLRSTRPRARAEPEAAEPEPVVLPHPEPVIPEELPHPVAAEAPGASFDAARHIVHPLHAVPEVGHHLAARELEDRIEIARATCNRDEIAFLLHDADDRVFGALLENPAIGEEEIVAVARGATRERIRRLVENRRAWSLAGVKAALLHNPHSPESVQVECINHVGSLRELASVMRDPRVRSFEVKSKARARLVERWRTMGPEERVAAIRQSGGELLSDLWNEAFSDERTLLRLLQDRSLDEAVVMKIVRSRIAPREVLAAIGRDPSWTNNYQVRLELTQNPKTPREIVAKLVAKLNPGDRARLKASGGASEFVREMA